MGKRATRALPGPKVVSCLDLPAIADFVESKRHAGWPREPEWPAVVRKFNE
jgi:hypothetical protein